MKTQITVLPMTDRIFVVAFHMILEDDIIHGYREGEDILDMLHWVYEIMVGRLP